MPPKAQKVNYIAEHDCWMVTTLHGPLRAEGYQSESGWKPQTWNCLEIFFYVDFPNDPGPRKTAEKWKDHYSFVKGNLKQVKQLRSCSGFSWDAENHLVTSTPTLWEQVKNQTDKMNAHSQKKPNPWMRWRATPFPLYDMMFDLVDSIIATGEFAFHPGGSGSAPAPTGGIAASASQDFNPNTPYTPSPPTGPRTSPECDSDMPIVSTQEWPPLPQRGYSPTPPPNPDLLPSSPIAAPAKRRRTPSPDSPSSARGATC